MDLKHYLEEKRKAVNAKIENILQVEGDHPLYEIYSYCLTGGKRFRPVLVMAAAEACGMSGDRVLPAACAMEFIHNFSLIHDDLPCMDNDDERRGIPTCHKKFGQTDALLAGDGMVIFSFALIAENGKIDGIRPESVVRVTELFSRAASHKGMTGGQVLDMHFQDNSAVTEEILEKIHRWKTGALITASVMAGGILSGADEEKIERLRVYGENIGLTYQIVDDLLDMEDDSQSISFPSVFGEIESRRMAADATRRAVESLDLFGENADPLRHLADYLLKRNM